MGNHSQLDGFTKIFDFWQGIMSPKMTGPFPEQLYQPGLKKNWPGAWAYLPSVISEYWYWQIKLTFNDPSQGLSVFWHLGYVDRRNCYWLLLGQLQGGKILITQGFWLVMISVLGWLAFGNMASGKCLQYNCAR